MTKKMKKLFRKNRWYVYLASVFFLMLTVALLAGKVTNLTEHIEHLQKQDGVFSYNGATYVKYEEAPITVQIYTKSSCETCEEDVQKIEKELRRFVPTLAHVDIVDVDQSHNADVVERYQFGYLPMTVFSDNVVETDFYRDAQSFFYSVDEEFVFYPHALGIVPREYVGTPRAADSLTQSTETANIAIYAFTDVVCDSCKAMYDVVSLVQKNYAQYVKTHTFFIADSDPRSEMITKAYYCAKKQEKGAAFADHVFARQAAWLAVENLEEVIASYARIVGLDEEQFETCADKEMTYSHDQEFERFGITKVPSLIIDGELYEGVQTYADLKKIIDQKIQQ